jgi:transposase
MSDTTVYTQLLDLKDPWYISKIEVDVAGEAAHIFISHHPGQMPCPRCGTLCNVRDHAEERTWRHLDLWQCTSWLHASMPRTDCPEHGVLRVSVPWSEPGSRFTMAFEERVILALQACKTVSGAETVMRISWDEAHGIMDRAVARGLRRRDDVEMPHLAVDEKSHGRKKFVTILMDLARGVVHGTAPGRTKQSMLTLLDSLTPQQVNAVEAIAMDMHDPYRDAVWGFFAQPGPAVVHDRFHIAKQMNAALNDVRKEEAAQLASEDDRTLVGSRQLWLFGEENVPKKRAKAFAKLKRSDLATAEVWAQKESLRRLWDCETVREARRHFKAWAAWVRNAGRKRVIKVVDMIEARLDDVISFCRHPISSGPLEGMNSIIMAIQRAGRGYRHAETFGRAIMFFCGGLDMSPSRTYPLETR